LKKTTHFAIVSVIAASMAASAANATAPVFGVPARVVEYSDLDLTRADGVSALYKRIERAARSVCGVDQTRELARITHARECVDTSVAHAVARVGVPALERYHSEKTHSSTPLAARS
jgi:UrcA family protein